LEVLWTLVAHFKSAMKNPLELRPDQVSDAASFLEFVRSLVNERRAMNAVGTESLSTTKEWESSTIEDFLDAAIRWAEDSDFGSDRVSARIRGSNLPSSSIAGRSMNDTYTMNARQ
jgi:hypothetical protein